MDNAADLKTQVLTHICIWFMQAMLPEGFPFSQLIILFLSIIFSDYSNIPLKKSVNGETVNKRSAVR